MNLHYQRKDLQRVAERASEWLEVLAEEPRAEERAAFAAWIAESPLHVREFLNIAAIDRQLEGVDPQRYIEIATRRAMPSTNVVPRQEFLDRSRGSADVDQASGVLPTLISAAAKRHHGHILRWRWAAGVAGLALGLAVVWWWQERGAWQEYITSVGEQNAIELADGTTVNLNTKSRLRVRFTKQARDLRLLEGEALFKVHHDPSHPFRVHVGANVIQAIGTEFNVHRRDTDDITVSVIEGKVEISPEKLVGNPEKVPNVAPPKLAAGEEARLVSNGHMTERRTGIDPATVTAWREHRLVFYRATLQEIAGEFNRYNVSPQIRVENDALRERRYTIILPANDPQSLIDYLHQSPDVAFEYDGSRVIIRPQGNAGMMSIK